jgi:hypothetical protein
MPSILAPKTPPSREFIRRTPILASTPEQPTSSWNRSGATSHAAAAVAFILLIGTVTRLAHLAFIDRDVPYRLGGLYAEFARQIAAEGYRLPHRIPFYTDGGIPFAYPPLPFYVEAVLLNTLLLPKFLVVNLLPVSIALVALPSFYFLTRQVGLPAETRLGALLAYATMPAAFIEQIEAGGLAEASGSLSLIWLAISLAWAHRQASTRSYASVAVAWAFCIVGSPGSAYASAPTVLLFAVLDLWRPGQPVRRRSLCLLGASGALAAMLSAPFWLTVIVNHGVQIFMSTFASEHADRLPKILLSLAQFDFLFLTGDYTGHYWWDVVLAAGGILTLYRRKWFPFAWFIILRIIPREGYWMAAIPGSLLVGMAIAEFRSLIVNNFVTSCQKGPTRPLATAVVILLMCLNLFVTDARLIKGMIDGTEDIGWQPAIGSQPSREALAAMNWLRDSTPVGSRFIVLARDQVREWVPHVAQRTVLNMPFGSEWEPDERRKIVRLEGLLKGCRDLRCVLSSVTEILGYQEVHVYIEKNRLDDLSSGASGQDARRAMFQLLWENGEVAVGRLRMPDPRTGADRSPARHGSHAWAGRFSADRHGGWLACGSECRRPAAPG